jgi:S1-C subfamily serine protease
LLVLGDKRGDPIAIGSGFFVREDVIATNYHVVKQGAVGIAKIVNQEQTYEFVGVVAIDPAHDLALVKLRSVRASPLQLANDGSAIVGDEVYVVGNPRSLEGTFSSGIVSAIRTDRQHRVLQITAPISPGSSGGPVLNSEGKVVGVAMATRTDAQNVNFAADVSGLRILIGKMGPPVPLPDR